MSAGRAHTVRIRARVLADMIDHAAAEAPLECCGLLVRGGGVIVAAHRTRNALTSATRYLVDPADHFSVLRRARADGLHVIGGYHSHPAGPAHPSARDIEESPGDDWLHVIASRPAPQSAFDASGFYISGGNFSPVVFVIER